MQLSFLDWSIIGLYFLLSTAIAVYYSRRAGKSMTEFFLSGRNLPWWIAGTTMVATTFAADTPLAVTELVAKHGIAGNWLWWNMLFGSMLTVFFYSRLWRRAGIMTDVEFVELRYSGKAAAFLRGFRALYLGLFMNVIIMGWVNLAMVKIISVLFPDLTFFGIQSFSLFGFTFSAPLLWVGLILIVVAIYSSLSGLWGVSITDAFQFTMAMIGSIALAIFALKSPLVGGIAGLKQQLPRWVFHFFPTVGETQTSAGGLFSLTALAFIAYLGVQWWASWYPGAEPGGGGYVAQRMMSAKDEKHSLFATLWFTIAHYAVRPWPWILVALASLVMFPELDPAHQGEGFVMVMQAVLPSGMLGLLLAAFLAAYMSTISTQLNWGTSYVINDFYRRFLKPEGEERTYIRVSRLTTILIMVISLVATSKMERISDAWIFILECSAGIGLVLILRWYWWRINAWSEIVAMVAPFVIYPFIRNTVEFPMSLFFIVGWSSILWLVFTFLTPPTEEKTLFAFYRRVHPGGRLWRPIAKQLPEVKEDLHFGNLLLCWGAGCVLVYASLLGLGKIILGDYGIGLFLLIIAGFSAGIIYYRLAREGWQTVTE